MLSDINHWNEELRSRLWKARQWKEKLEAEIKLQQAALEKWAVYIEALERTQELESELDLSSGIAMNGAKAKTITESLIIFGLQNADYILTPKNAINWLIEQRLYTDEKGAGNSVYGILANRIDLFDRQDRALYKLTNRAIELGRELIQPRLSIAATVPSNVKHTPLGGFILQALKEGEKTLAQLEQEAKVQGFSFQDKKPKRVFHFALIGMARHRLVERVNGVWRLKEPKSLPSIS